jgi:hypothetical protein
MNKKVPPPHRTRSKNKSNTWPFSAHSPFHGAVGWAASFPSCPRPCVSLPFSPDASGFPCPSSSRAGATDCFHPFRQTNRGGREDGLRRTPAGAGEGGGRNHRLRAWGPWSRWSAVHVLRLPVSLSPIRRSFHLWPLPPTPPLMSDGCRLPRSCICWWLLALLI